MTATDATRVLVRTDSSTATGTGHAMRCLTLAVELAAHGARVSFVCRALPGSVHELIAREGFDVVLIPATCDGNTDDAHATLATLPDATRLDWVIVDHYALDEQWERRLRRVAQRIMAIDDLADRAHDCDVLLDQNLHRDAELRYRNLVPARCRLFLGPRHALLRREFRVARAGLRERTGAVERILVFFGGTDPTGETSKALEALAMLDSGEISIDVVVGQGNAQRTQVQERCAAMPGAAFHCQVDNMAELIARADLALGAGGATTWERCMLGLPAITVITAPNQAEMTRTLDEDGVIRTAGWHADLTADDLAGHVAWARAHPDALVTLSRKALALMDRPDGEMPTPLLDALLPAVAATS